MISLNDIEPVFDDQFSDLSRFAPAVNDAAVTAGAEAPVMKQQRAQAAPRQPKESLREVYRSGREKSLKENPEGDRKPFKWGDLDPDQKKDTLLRLGLALMQHSQSGIGLSGIGKAGSETLSFLDELQEKNRADAKGRRKESSEEGLTLAQLAGAEQDNAARDRQLDQGDRQVLPGVEGYTLANLASGEATPITTGEGEPVLPASSGENSVFKQQYRLWLEIAKDRGMKAEEAKAFAANQASKNRTHVTPDTYIRARDQVMETLMPNGRPSRQMRELMEATGNSAQEIVDAHTDQLLEGYQSSYGDSSLSEFGGEEAPADNPFILN